MKRRAVVAVAAALVLAGCGDGRASGTAASVDGTTVSRDQYEELLQVFVANAELTGLQEDVATGTVAADQGRQWLSLLVIDAARREFLTAADESVTDADRQTVLAQVNQDDPVLDFPEDLLNLLVDQQAAGAALGRAAASTGDVQARYEASPVAVGVLCVRHILLETEEDARAVLEELAAGADFAELATERSIEPAAAQTGGAIEPQAGQPCFALSDAETALDPTFVAGAARAVPSTPTEPVQTAFGWHVILARPYAEVGPAVEVAAGQQLFDQYLSTAEVEVDPRYGRWDPAERAVVAL